MFPLSLLLSLFLTPTALALGVSREPSPCRPDLLAVYRLSVITNWSEAAFPRQYPQWRPPAQWSKTLGFSHTDKFSLFSLGQPVTEDVKKFVELGDSTGLDARIHNSSLLDSFTAPPIMAGAGESTARIFLDGRHTKVSLLTKLVPSPDWFIGLDSLDLCQNGHFIDSITLEADPLDAGTDNGFTFTSPNWPTEPAGVSFRITNSYPPHPAGSFHYPHLARLPSIATFHLQKEAEYSLSQQFDHVAEAERLRYKVDNQLKEEEFNFVPVSAPRSKRKLHDSAAQNLLAARESSISSKLLRKGHRKLTLRRPLEAEDKTELYNSILRSYPQKGLGRGRRKRVRGDRRLRRHKEKKVKQDCKVSAWGAWGTCSKTCDIGEAIRSRRIEVAPKHGGHVCPPLKQMQWCGSARNCKEEYFGW